MLAYWNDSDVRNLHQWGVWVENSVNDLDEKEHAKLGEAVSFLSCPFPSRYDATGASWVPDLSKFKFKFKFKLENIFFISEKNSTGSRICGPLMPLSVLLQMNLIV